MRRGSSRFATFSCECALRSLSSTTPSSSLAIAEDDGEARAERVGAAELRLDRGLARVDLAAHAGLADVATEHERGVDGALADRRDDDVDHVGGRRERRSR